MNFQFKGVVMDERLIEIEQGQKFEGYEVVRPLKTGLYATGYLARDLRTGQEVIIKELSPVTLLAELFF